MRATIVVATALVSGVVAKESCCAKTIKKDVAIIGGGAAGSHAAVWLRDHGRTNVVIEKADQLVSLCQFPLLSSLLPYISSSRTTGAVH